MARMIGKVRRMGCGSKRCTCNTFTLGRIPARAAKRGERQRFRREVSNGDY